MRHHAGHRQPERLRETLVRAAEYTMDQLERWVGDTLEGRPAIPDSHIGDPDGPERRPIYTHRQPKWLPMQLGSAD